MNSGIYYQALASLLKENTAYNYPRALKEILRKGEITSVAEFQQLLSEEVGNCPLSDTQVTGYFWFISEVALNFALFRGDFENYRLLSDTIEKRMAAANLPETETNESWKNWFGFINLAAARIRRTTTIEQFESTLEEIEWSDTDPDFIYRYSGLIGMVYLMETHPGRQSKARFWLQKAANETSLENGLAFYLNTGPFLFADRKPDNHKRIEDFISKLDHYAATSQDAGLARVLRTAVMEMHARALLLRLDMFDDADVKLEENLGSIREIERNFDFESKTSPVTLRALLKGEFAKAYLSLAASVTRKEDAEDITAIALDSIDDGWQASLQCNDAALTASNRLLWMKAISTRETKASDRELRELASNFRKSENLPACVSAHRSLSRFYISQNQSQKAYEALSDVYKAALKASQEDGYYLAVKTFGLITDVFHSETTRPGVSWIVNEGNNWFSKVAELVDSLDDQKDKIGMELFSQFRKDYSRFEAASHFNAKAYLRYQFYTIKLMRIAAIYNEDEAGLLIANNLVKELENANNPLTFIKADWPDFKDVPNEVRNKMLNKCISISKGDLPMAADHLEFSYRNLRSYITFKEVNRLGFFLDEQQTTQRQLEQGIRLMFHDLYRDGTIFEVVFDMPKFLVAHANSGFSSQDLEEALDIKGTTAKKYIKIMTDVGLIKHEKSLGRKHFYRLRRANVMTRYGNELGNEQKITTGS